MWSSPELDDNEFALFPLADNGRTDERRSPDTPARHTSPQPGGPHRRPPALMVYDQSGSPPGLSFVTDWSGRGETVP